MKQAWITEPGRDLPVTGGLDVVVAGIGAALAVRQSGGDMQALSIPGLQNRIREQGGILSPELVKPAVE